MKYRLFFPDGDIFRDEDGVTEFSKRWAEYFRDRLIDHVTLELRPWPPFERFCRQCQTLHPYAQDGCDSWPTLCFTLNLGVGQRSNA